MIPSVAVVVTAAGKSERFGGGKKEYRPLGGSTVLANSLSAFLDLPGLVALVVTVPPGGAPDARAALGPGLAGRVRFVEGGSSRRESVLSGLRALADVDPDLVLVHDGARPFVTRDLAERVARAASASEAIVPLVPLVDTPKEVDADGLVVRHPPRGLTRAAQTPQGFCYRKLLAAHETAHAEGRDFTDDAELYAAYAGPVRFVEGESSNRKITFPGDLDATSRASAVRTGQGWDIHRLVPNRRLILGGVEIPFDVGEDGHSDGDVLFHALTDAVLGAAALGDIGAHFPPSDTRWKDAPSRVFFERALSLARDSGWAVVNLDCTVILERPKLRPHVDAIRASIAEAAGLPVDSVSVKAKTCEGLGPVGEGRAVEAQAIATLSFIGR